jgi:hypothetical protein
MLIQKVENILSKMIKQFFCIACVFIVLAAKAQVEDDKVIASVKAFHQALVNKNTISINQQTDKALSYGHSNGWVETKNELIKNLESGYIGYSSYKEDSVTVSVNGTMANVRFIANIDATLNGVLTTYHLKVLEVWVKKGKRWMLFARQSVKG